jgi:hypothetical protein
MNKLLTLSSEGKLSIIDTVLDKYTKQGGQSKIKGSKIEEIKEEDEELNEEEALKEI